jgi:translation elongation factor EF-4
VRSLASCQGALLLVDACQGIQAQTLSTYHAAQEAGIAIIPVVTKIDLPNAAVDDTVLSLATTFGLEPDDVIATSAKAGIGIEAVLDAIVAVSVMLLNAAV